MKNLFLDLKIHFLPMTAAILLLFSSCATVPITERRPVHLVSDQEPTTLSLQEYSKVLQQSKLSQNSARV